MEPRLDCYTPTVPRTSTPRVRRSMAAFLEAYDLVNREANSPKIMCRLAPRQPDFTSQMRYFLKDAQVLYVENQKHKKHGIFTYGS